MSIEHGKGKKKERKKKKREKKGEECWNKIKQTVMVLIVGKNKKSTFIVFAF